MLLNPTNLDLQLNVVNFTCAFFTAIAVPRKLLFLFMFTVFRVFYVFLWV